MKIYSETESYIALIVPGGNDGKSSMEEAVNWSLKCCEQLKDKGYRPLHYIPRLSAWICEKPQRMKHVA